MVNTYMKIRNERLEKVHKKDIKNGTVLIPEEVKVIGTLVFSNIEITHITIPDTVEILEFSAFSGCQTLLNVVISNPNCILGGAAFANCSNLRNITLPENVKILPDYLFNNCINLQEIIIPNTVKFINIHQFSKCSSLKKIYYKDHIYTYQDLLIYENFI